MGNLTSVDWAVIGTYFFVLVVIVVAVARRQQTTTDYFLAGRNVGFFAIAILRQALFGLAADPWDR